MNIPSANRSKKKKNHNSRNPTKPLMSLPSDSPESLVELHYINKKWPRTPNPPEEVIENFIDRTPLGPVDEMRRVLTFWPDLANAHNERGVSALGWAVFRGYIDVVELLLEFGASFSSAKFWGENMAFTTFMGVRNDFILWMVKNHLQDLDLTGRSSQFDGAGVAAVVLGLDDDIRLQVLEAVLKAGAPVNLQRTTKGTTALHDAIENDFLAELELLVTYGADAGLKDAEGKSALDRATSNDAMRLALEK